MIWLQRIGRALLVLFGADDAESLRASMQRDLDRAAEDLKAAKADAAVLASALEEARHERDEWKGKAMAALPPGERLNAGVDDARRVLSRLSGAKSDVAPVPPKRPAKPPGGEG